MIRRGWEVVEVMGHDDHGLVHRFAYTEEGAWRRARRLWRTTPRLRSRYSCSDLMPLDVLPMDADGYLIVRRRGDGRSITEVLNEALTADVEPLAVYGVTAHPDCLGTPLRCCQSPDSCGRVGL